MSPLFRKLNLGAHTRIAVFNAPASFEPELAALDGVSIDRDPAQGIELRFALGFAVTQRQLDALSRTVAAASVGDAVLWFAYPKGTSKRFRCEFSRDTGWDVMRAAGFDTVRAVAIDEDWSALRFRRNEYIRAR